MTHKGEAFQLAFKRRELESGPEVYRACDALQQTISRLYGSLLSNLAARTVGAAHWPLEYWPRPATWRRFRPSWAISIWITVSPI